MNSLREAFRLARSDMGTEPLRAAVRRVLTAGGTSALFVLAAGTSVALWLLSGAPAMLPQVIAHSMFLVVAVIFTWNLAKLRRRALDEARAARRANGLCARCGYPLPGIPPNSRCPECGSNQEGRRPSISDALSPTSDGDQSREPCSAPHSGQGCSLSPTSE